LSRGYRFNSPLNQFVIELGYVCVYHGGMKQPSAQRQDRGIFVEIFTDHWDSFKERYPAYEREQYEEPVEKMLECGKESGGYSEYICMHCGMDLRRVCFSCKSYFCLSCAKGYVDEFVSQVSKVLHPGVVYRHVILTVPQQLRVIFYRNRHSSHFLSAFMRCGYECLEDVVGTVRRRPLKIGAIVVVQTHGRSGHYNPHIHIIMTNGGIDTERGKWVDLGYFPYEVIHKKWQYHLFRMVKSFFGTEEIKGLVDELWKMYPKGLVAHVKKGRMPESCRGLARYLAKYVASPPIAVRRIVSYDGRTVEYWYRDHESRSKRFERVDVMTFIGRMVQHIFPKGFQRVRYFGLQATKTFRKWAEVIGEGLRRIGRVVKGVYQVVSSKSYRERYREVSGHDPQICRHCGCEMELWRIWHPKYGVIYDELERIKAGKYGSLPEWEGGGGYSVWPTAGGVQLSLFPMRA